MLIYEYKLYGTAQQFIRNQCSCAVLAHDYSFAALLPSGKHLTFTDSCDIGQSHLVGHKKQRSDASWVTYSDMPIVAVKLHFTNLVCSGVEPESRSP